jgi:hypothetical protein
MIRPTALLFAWLSGVVILAAQGTTLPLGTDAYHIVDRLDISSGVSAPFFSSLKYYTRGDVARYAMSLDSMNLSRRDRKDLEYLYRDNNEWISDSFYNQLNKRPILKTFYRTPAHLWEIDKPYFHLRANPILGLHAGQARDDEHILFNNQRGLELRGGIDDRIYFYTNVLESQTRFPEHVNRLIERDRAVPGAGLFKPYNSIVFDFNDGYDYLLSQGYLGFNVTRHVGVQFGHGRHFIGHGYRSLLLSDFSNNYLYLKLNWRVWKLHLQNIFMELAQDSDLNSTSERLLPKRYMAAHYLGFSPLPNLTFGFYEAVVFSRVDKFEFQYLNPVILYRTVEQAIGSPDNILIGLDAKWNFLKRFQLYGQLMLDEFKFDELFLENQGWWANKYGVQVGLKYVDVLGIDHLDAQVETNWVRPYTYAHFDSTAIYANYQQALAHPLGANFREYVARLRYQPFPRLLLQARLIRATTGLDPKGENWGGNILLPNGTRQATYGNFIGQGIATTITLAGLELRYALYHNMFLELEFFQRIQESEAPEHNYTTRYIGGGLRVNLAKTYNDF